MDIQKELNPAEMEQISGGHSTEHYTKKIYTNTEYRDNTDEMINSMLITTSLSNETTDSIDMTEVIKVDLNADYQKLNQLEDMSNLFDNNTNNQNNNTNNLITENYDQINNSNSSNHLCST